MVKTCFKCGGEVKRLTEFSEKFVCNNCRTAKNVFITKDLEKSIKLFDKIKKNDFDLRIERGLLVFSYLDKRRKKNTEISLNQKELKAYFKYAKAKTNPFKNYRVGLK